MPAKRVYTTHTVLPGVLLAFPTNVITLGAQTPGKTQKTSRLTFTHQIEKIDHFFRFESENYVFLSEKGHDCTLTGTKYRPMAWQG